MKSEAVEFRTCCVVVGEGYGNMIMCTPAVEALTQLGCLCDLQITHGPPGAAGLFEGWSAVGRVCGPDEVPEREYDLVYVTRWGQASRAPGGRQVLRPRVRSGQQDHEIEMHMAPVRELGFAGPTPLCHVEHDRAAGSGYIALCPYYGGEKEKWRRRLWDGFPELARRLVRAGRRVVILGGPSDAEPWHRHYESRIGTQDIRGAATVLSGAAAAVCIDNGLGHIARGVGTSVIALFGSTYKTPMGATVIRTGERCAPCQDTPAWDQCNDWKCMKISVDTVFDAVQAIGGGKC